MKSFELYEAYFVQKDEQAKLHAGYSERVDKARAAVDTAKIKADEVIHAEIASGVDKTAEKTAARKAIDKAEQALAYALDEQRKAFAYQNPAAIRDVDVVQAWLTDYKPAVEADDMASIQERVKLGRDLMLSALFDHHQLQRDYHGLTESVREISDTAKKTGRQSAYYTISNPIGNLAAAGFSADELAQYVSQIISGRELPPAVTYTKEVSNR